MATAFLVEAFEQLKGYEKTGKEEMLRQACEKGWGAVAQALMHASGKDLTQHREFGQIGKQLTEKTGDQVFARSEALGEALHAGGFYHGALSPEAVDSALSAVGELITAVERLEGS